MPRHAPNGLDVLLAEWGVLTRLERQGKSVEWPPHQLPIVLAVMRMPERLRRVLETRYAGPPSVSPFDRPAVVAMSHTRYHAALDSAKSFVEGFVSADRAG
jgi:hypothetical protein